MFYHLNCFLFFFQTMREKRDTRGHEVQRRTKARHDPNPSRVESDDSEEEEENKEEEYRVV